MHLIPAIDLLQGKVVRLRHGDFAQVTFYPDDVLAYARRYQNEGAQALHVVDLSAAKSGTQSTETDAVRALLATGLSLQLGGGIRTYEDAKAWLELGVHRIVLGTIALTEPDVARTLCAEYRDRIVVAVDAKDGWVASHGWEQTSSVSAIELGNHAVAWGAAALLYTDISRDGALAGPAIAATASLQKEVAIPVIASGGISSVDDIAGLARANIAAAVCGRALLDQKFSYCQALGLANVTAQPLLHA